MKEKREERNLRDYELLKLGSYVPYISRLNVGGIEKKAVKDVDWGGTRGLEYYRPRWSSPLLSFVNYYIPFDRATLYQWIRYYDTFHPLIGNAIDFHTQMPLSRFALRGIEDQKVHQFFEEMLETMGAFLLIYDMLREYWLIGECFVYLVWDDDFGGFVDGEIIMPEYVEVKGHPFVTGKELESSFVYYLIPDDAIKEFIKRPEPELARLKENIPIEIIEAIEEGRPILISNFNLMPLMRKQSRYNPRGTSIVLRCLKDLLYEDKLRECQYAIADRHIFPKEIWKLGNEKMPPSAAKLKSFAELLREAEDQPKFTLVTHYAVNLEVVGASGQLPQLAAEFDWVENRILTAMFLNKALTHGEGPTYANASIATRALLMRYIQVRSQLEDLIKEKIFIPVSLYHGFYRRTKAELEHRVRTTKEAEDLIVPEFDWRYKSNLLDDAAVRDLIASFVREGRLPMKALLDILGLDAKVIEQQLKQEEGTPFDSLYRQLKEQVEKKGMKIKEATLKDEDLVFFSRGGIKRKIETAEKLLKNKNIDVIGLILGNKQFKITKEKNNQNKTKNESNSA